MYPASGLRQAIKARAGLELLEPPRTLMLDADTLAVSFTLPVHGISLLAQLYK